LDKSGKKMKDNEIAEKLYDISDMRPVANVRRFGLKNPIFSPTASYGHFGRNPYTKEDTVIEDGRAVKKEVEFFGWEKLDYVDKIKEKFQIK